MRKFFIEYFNYSAKELRPLYYLIVLLLLSIIIRSTINSPASREYLPDPELLRKNQALIENLRIQDTETENGNESQNILLTDLFFFDPNTIEISQLKKLGFNEKIISNLSRYRESGGRFFQPEDLKIIYGLNENVYREVEKWIEIKPINSNNEISVSKIDSQSINSIQKQIELNSLTYKELIQLTGGNSKMTGRILNYKNLLGGYYSIEQLREVYEMNDSLYNSMYFALKVDTMLIAALSINSSDYSDLLRHPYLEKVHVNLIMKYREYKNSRIDLNEFLESQILEDSALNKIRPYLRN